MCQRAGYRCLSCSPVRYKWPDLIQCQGSEDIYHDIGASTVLKSTEKVEAMVECIEYMIGNQYRGCESALHHRLLIPFVAMTACVYLLRKIF